MPESLFTVIVVIMSSLVHDWVMEAEKSVPRSATGRVYIDYDLVRVDELGRKYIPYVNPPISIDMICKYIETYENCRLKNVPQA